MSDDLQPYCVCIKQQLEELELLNSIYCAAGELQLLDASVVTDFNEFAQTTTPALAMLHSYLEYSIALKLPPNDDKLDVRVELPHLYPLLERPIVSVQTALLSKAKHIQLKQKLECYLAEQQTEPFIYQMLSWLQEQIEQLILPTENDSIVSEMEKPLRFDFERLWIYSHHIKSSAKRQEIIKQARQLELSGFSRPGKPGIICVEGESEHVQQFWRTIKALRWQKITLVKSEEKQHLTTEQFHKHRRFNGFTEQLMCSVDAGEESPMNMGQFIRFLEAHGSGYMKTELFDLA